MEHNYINSCFYICIFNFQSHGLSRTVANPSIKSKYFSTCRCIKRVHVLDALKALAESLLSISAAQKAIALQNQLNRNYAYDMCANSGRTKWGSNHGGSQHGRKERRKEGRKERWPARTFVFSSAV